MTRRDRYLVATMVVGVSGTIVFGGGSWAGWACCTAHVAALIWFLLPEI